MMAAVGCPVSIWRKLLDNTKEWRSPGVVNFCSRRLFGKSIEPIRWLVEFMCRYHGKAGFPQKMNYTKIVDEFEG